jgi:hypothetical protein
LCKRCEIKNTFENTWRKNLKLFLKVTFMKKLLMKSIIENKHQNIGLEMIGNETHEWKDFIVVKAKCSRMEYVILLQETNKKSILVDQEVLRSKMRFQGWRCFFDSWFEVPSVLWSRKSTTLADIDILKANAIQNYIVEYLRKKFCNHFIWRKYNQLSNL